MTRGQHRACPTLATVAGLSFALSAVLTVTLCPTAALAIELPNAGVETADPKDPTRPAGWSTSVWGDYVKISGFTWIKPGYEGQRALRVELKPADKAGACDCGDGKWWSDPLSVVGEDLLQIGDRYRSDRASKLMVLFERPASAEKAARKAWMKVAEVAAAKGWTAAEGTVQVPSWAQTMRVLHLIDGPGWLETDAYTVAVGEAAELPLPDKGKVPLVSITFDDGWVSAYHLLIPLMDERGLKGSHFIVSDFLDKPGYQADYIGSKQLIDLANRGHEIGSHSRLHDDQAKLDTATLRDDLTGSKVRLESFGANIVGFAPPYGSYNDGVLDESEKRYSYLRTVEAGLNAAPYKTRKLNAVVVHDTMPLPEFASWVIKAATEGKWLILLYHRAADDPPADSYVRPKAFAQQMDYLLAAKADVKPMGEVLGVWTHAPIVIEEPDIKTGKHLPVPDSPGKATGYREPPKPDSGCAAMRAAKVSWHIPVLVIAAFFAFRLRRRRVRRDFDEDGPPPPG